MKKLLIKTSLFILPFVFFSIINHFFYKEEGDLVRMGYLYTNPSPKSNVSNQFLSTIDTNFLHISKIDTHLNNTFDIFTIGDSFSEQEGLGYQNFITKKNSSVLHFDRFLSHPNQIQRLIEIANGDLLDSLKINYILLQVVERSILRDCNNLDFSKSITLNSIKKSIAKQKNKKNTIKKDFFFNTKTIKAPFFNIQYLFIDKPIGAKTYKVKTNTNTLFSGNPDNLLFYYDDVNRLDKKNNLYEIEQVNTVLNKINTLLSNKNIKLLVMISPDKYDVYYPYIQNKKMYSKPIFFSHFDSLKKSYIYIPTFKILSKASKQKQNLYYYDDTHWSPIAAKIIADEVSKIINKK